jgi:PAS domain-containing protein
LANTLDNKWSQLGATLFEDLSEGVFVFDASMAVVFRNPALQRLLRLPAALFAQPLTVSDLMLACARRGDFGPGDAETLAGAARDHLTDAHTTFLAWPSNGHDALRFKARDAEDGIRIVFVTEEDVTSRPRPGASARAGGAGIESRKLEAIILS